MFTVLYMFDILCYVIDNLLNYALWGYLMKGITTEVQLYETDSRFPYKSFTNYMMSTQNHWHTEIEFIYLLENYMDAYINGTYYKLSPRDIMFASSGDIHGILYSNNKRFVIQFELEILEGKFLDHSQIRKIRKILSSREKVSPNWPPDAKREIEEIILALKKADENCDREDIAYRLNILSLLSRLIYICCEKLPENADQSVKSQTLQSKRVLAKLEEVFGFVRDNYWKDIRLEDAAKQLGYSPNHFTKVWKKYTGLNFHTYLNGYRISCAMSLLSDTNLSISEIGYKVGFQSLKTFNRVFKSVTQTTPSEYRRSIEKVKI
ncbi:MAG TPA: AraC family transcriptional regulator [Clostridiales bacterium]|nr:AraC family transcriptional regulator [Clostridiales bacterium]